MAGMTQRQLWLVRPDGSDAHPLAPEATSQSGAPPRWADWPRWSADGQMLLSVRTVDGDAQQAQLWLADLDGGQQRLLADQVSLRDGGPSYYGYVDWSDRVDWWQPVDAVRVSRQRP
jgi:hypothetical protein